MNVSIVISTYNRARSLRDTLESLVAQETGRLTYEIVVVDNNSRDKTHEEVYQAMAKCAHPVRYLFETKQGVSYARNAGIRCSSGEIIAFTDDDVVVDKHWVRTLWECFSETDADAVGGRIERLWRCEKPEWFTDEIGAPLISQYLGPSRKRWDLPTRHLVGANMAFRREVFKSLGPFRVELGRRGAMLIGGEDREMFERLWKAKRVIFYEPFAVVWHKVEAERLSQEYMRSWFWEIGKTLGHGMERRRHHFFTVAPFWVWKEAARSLLRYATAQTKPAVDHAEKFSSEMWIRFHAGIFQERFYHWLPSGLGDKNCIFKKEK